MASKTCKLLEKQQQQQQQQKHVMETHFTRLSRPECQICFNPFSTQRRPKLLGCQHTCCSVCLGQMVLNHREIRCPWCRQVTHLSGLSVFQLPDDPEAIAAAHVPIYIKLPNSSCYLLPLAMDEHAYYERQYELKNTEEAAQAERTEGVEEEEEVREEAVKSSGWTGFCTILLVAVIFIFLLAIILHNMSCVSKRFSLISCG